MGRLACAGAEIRWEKADDPGVPGTQTGSIVGLGYSKFSMSRDVYAMYGEVVAPVAKWLELNAAVRWDHYSDFGNSVTPKIGFKARPTEQFLIRGTYAEAFRAPGPAEVGGSSFGFTTFGILSQGNPDIQPEEAKSYTLGFVFEPVAGTSFTLDFWKIDRKNEIVQADPNSIIGSLPSTGTPLTRINGALPNTFIYYDVDGNIGTVTGFYRNASKTKTDGFDFSAQHRMSLGDSGRSVGAGVLDARQQARAHRRVRQLARLRRHPRPAGAELRHRGAEGPRHGDADLGPWTGGVDLGHQLRRPDHAGRSRR